MRLIGTFGLFDLSGNRIEVRSRKAVALLALLASAPDGIRTRIWLQTMLWGSRARPQAQSSLRRELSTLANILEKSGAKELLFRESQRIQLNLDKISIDVLSIGVDGSRSSKFVDADFLEGLDLRDSDEFEDWLRRQRNRTSELLKLEFPEPTQPLPNAADVYGGPLPPVNRLLEETVSTQSPKPSISVVPFVDVERSSRLRLLGIAVAEEIGMTLSQYPQLFVVASSAAAALASRSMTSAEIATGLGVRYLLMGSIIASNSKLKINIQLIRGKTGEQIWSKQFNTNDGQNLSIEEQIAKSVVPQIWTNIDLIERHRGLITNIRSLDSYDLYWRANGLFRTGQKHSVLEAVDLAEQLATSNPTCPFSASLAAFCNGFIYLMDWSVDRQSARRSAIKYYQNALRFGGNNIEALGYAAGTLILIGGNIRLADQLVSHALSLLPAYQPTLFWGGWVDVVMGNTARARERFELALHINPSSEVRKYTIAGIGLSFLLEGEIQSAYPFLLRAGVEQRENPVVQAALAIAASQIGENEIAKEARQALEETGGKQAVLSVLRSDTHKKIFQLGLDMVDKPDI